MNLKHLVHVATFFPLLLSVSSFAQSPTNSAGSKPIDVEFCELIAHPSLYSEKNIRVRAIYVIGFEASLLYEPKCNRGRESRLWIGFAESVDASSKPDVVKVFDHLMEPPNRPNDIGELRRAEVVFSGRFLGPGQYGHLGGWNFQITVQSIEMAKPVADNVPW